MCIYAIGQTRRGCMGFFTFVFQCYVDCLFVFVQVLLQILNSTPETLDAQIEHYAEDIDEDMLYTLQRRIDAAHKMKQVRSQTMSCCILQINVYIHL